jgi:hypothetical protein
MSRPLFSVGDLYAHQEIQAGLGVGNSGGIRVALDDRRNVARVVLFSTSDQPANPKDNPYLDQAQGDILTYTGTGKIGDQALAGANLRLTEQAAGCFPIYVFSLWRHRKTTGSPDRRWRFLGVHKYLEHRRQSQPDLLAGPRRAWVFKLLKLPLLAAGPANESELRTAVSQAWADPALSPAALLGTAAGYPVAELAEIVGQMQRMPPPRFEQFIKQTLVASRFREVSVTRQSADGGIDLLARLPLSVWVLEAQSVQIQVKRWSKPVGRREVAELRGSLSPRSSGAIISTGNYSQTALAEADRPHCLPISLVDGFQLATVVKRLRLPPLGE